LLKYDSQIGEPKMVELGITYINNHLKEVVDRVEGGEAIWITRRGKRIAIFAPLGWVYPK
jgi:antitoxin (DNA-binding transcriptional repressor) of toxin-antitoxin stability system